MNLIVYFFTFLLSCNSVFSHKNNSSAEPNLWQQIIPLMQSKVANKTPSMPEILRSCTAQAILLDGDTPLPLTLEKLQTLDSLHVFSDVLPKFAANNLTWGYFALAQQTCKITDDVKILNERNNCTSYLQSNPELLKQFNRSLASLKTAESDFLLLFYVKLLKREEANPDGPIEEGLFYLEKLEQTILSNRYTGGIYKLVKQCNSIWGLGASLVSLYYFSNFHQKNVADVQSALSNRMGDSAGSAIASYWPVSIPYTALCTLGTVIGMMMTTKSLKADFSQASLKQKNLMLFKDVIKACQKILEIIEDNPMLEYLLSENRIIKNFAEWKKHPEHISANMYHLLDLLDYYPFNQEPDSFPWWQGKIYETYALYEELKQEIVPLWQALGTLDAHVSIQNTLANHPHLFCIPQWLENDRPMLHIQDYWHPIIQHQKVVKNTIELGINGIAPNSIITGANAGGKTTAMSAIMLCAIFAQSLGIAPAKTYQATPFARIHTYLDITTNLTNNESLFVAQANRAKQLYDSIANCKAGEKTLTILDEIFTGTRADFAEEASFEFAQKLGNMPHSISIIATHFPKLTNLKDSGLFINYHAAPATINPDGTLNYPYIISPGISEQNVAHIILKRNGLID